MKETSKRQATVIRSWKSMSNEYGTDDSTGWIIPDYKSAPFFHQMKELCAKAITIIPYMTIGYGNFNIGVREVYDEHWR